MLAELNRRNVTRAALAYLAGAWLLIQIADTVFPAFDLPQRALTVLIVVVAIGFLPAMVVAWAFEVTPAGLRRDDGANAVHTVRSTRLTDRVIMSVLAIALGYFALDKFVFDSLRDQRGARSDVEQLQSTAERDPSDRKSIAVLAFDDLSPDGDQAYLSEGIAEELLNLLAQIPDVRVVARTSAFSFKGKNMTVAQIAEQLNVATVLEGSVRLFGDQLRVRVQLVDARSEASIWSQTYNQRFEDIFAIQDDIAASVVDKLKVTLIDKPPQSKRTDPAAYALYLQARQLNHRNTPAASAIAKPLLERALEIEPGFAVGMAELARSTFMTGIDGSADGAQVESTWRACIELIDKAVALEPDQPFINAWLAWIEILYRKNLSTGLAHIDRALTLGPNNDDALRLASVLYLMTGLFDRSIELSETLLERDPLCVICHYATAMAFIAADRIEDAESSLQTLLVLAEGPRLAEAQRMMGALRLFQNRPAEALEVFEGGQVDEPHRSRGIVLALHDLGRLDEFKARFAELRETWLAAEPPWAAGPASVYAWMGDTDQAFQWLMRGVNVHDYSTGPYRGTWDPYLRKIKSDPRWAQVVQREAELLGEAQAGGL